MKEHFNHELTKLLDLLYAQGTRAENLIRQAVQAFAGGDAEPAESILLLDRDIDREEIHIEEECLKILALYQPVAGDLRTVISYLKINTALERIADFGCHIAERAVNLSRCELPENRVDFTTMVQPTLSMLHDTLLLIVNTDIAKAYRVIETDNTVDALRCEHRRQARALLAATPVYADYYTDCIGMARDLERIADLCTDICEHLIYRSTGCIVRHGGS